MKRLAKPIYVEIFIRGTLEDLWRLTQTPELHTRWDLRFSRIEYLPQLALAEATTLSLFHPTWLRPHHRGAWGNGGRGDRVERRALLRAKVLVRGLEIADSLRLWLLEVSR